MKNTQKEIFEFYKNSKILYKLEIIILIVIIAISCCFSISLFSKNGETVEVIYKNALVFSCPLSKDNIYKFDKNGENLVVIKDSKVYIQHSDCENQICVKSKAIDKSNQIIVCAPHNLIVKIVGKKDYDGMTGGGYEH